MPNLEDIPYIFIAKLHYDSSEIKAWNSFSPSDHWGIYNPIHTHDEWWDTRKIKDFIIRIPKNEYQNEISRYWNVKKVIYTYCPLLDINSDNFKEKIFNEIEKLSQIKE